MADLSAYTPICYPGGNPLLSADSSSPMIFKLRYKLYDIVTQQLESGCSFTHSIANGIFTGVLSGASYSNTSIALYLAMLVYGGAAGKLNLAVSSAEDWLTVPTARNIQVEQQLNRYNRSTAALEAISSGWQTIASASTQIPLIECREEFFIQFTGQLSSPVTFTIQAT